MDKNKLLGDLTTRGLNVGWLVAEMNKKDTPISMSTFYKKLRGESQFKASEIKAISQILKFSEEETFRIFFTELVS